ncbi:serine/threonine protein kinase, partial [bacterium]
MPKGPLAAALLASFFAAPCRGGTDGTAAYDDARAHAQSSHAELDTASLTPAEKKERDQAMFQLNHSLKDLENKLPTDQQGVLGPSILSAFTDAYKTKNPTDIMTSMGELGDRFTKMGLSASQIHEAQMAMFQALHPRLQVLQGSGATGLSNGNVPAQTKLPTTEPVVPNIRQTFMDLASGEGVTPQAKAVAVQAPGNVPHDKVVKMATEAIEGGVKDPAVYLIRGQSAEKLGDNELANRDALYAYRADPSNRAAESLYRLTRDRPSSVHILKPAALEGDEGRLEAAGLDGGASRPQWDGRQGGEAGAPQGALSAEQIAAQENAALNARPVTARSAKLTSEAKAALHVNDAKSALRLTEEAIAADPNNADARYVRAAAFLRLQEPARAAAEASAGLELAPDNPTLLYTRAVANGRQKLWRDAYADAERTVRSAPRRASSYQVRAAANWALGRKSEMMQDLKNAARLDPSYQAALQRASQLPDDDPTLLFGDPSAAAAAPAAAPARPPYLFWGIGSLLAVIGIAPFLVPDLRGKVTTVFRRGPAADEEGAAADVPLTGFWKRYEVTREIGAGGMGVVYEAWDRQLERRAAVKRMRDEIRNDRRERERFLQEARMVARLRHPNLVEIYSIEEDGPDAYLVFEFVEGQNLHEMLQEKGRFTPAEARDVFRGLCAGVDYAHRQGVVHRDLKPANVIVEPDGTVKVMDFGVARQAQDALARRQMTNTIIGTPQYMAPEQEEGVVCTQSDVYALGVCLYELLAGSAPFSGSAGAVTLAKREAKYEPLTKRVADLPPAVAQVVERALDPNP